MKLAAPHKRTLLLVLAWAPIALALSLAMGKIESFTDRSPLGGLAIAGFWIVIISLAAVFRYAVRKLLVPKQSIEQLMLESMARTLEMMEFVIDDRRKNTVLSTMELEKFLNDRVPAIEENLIHDPLPIDAENYWQLQREVMSTPCHPTGRGKQLRELGKKSQRQFEELCSQGDLCLLRA